MASPADILRALLDKADALSVGSPVLPVLHEEPPATATPPNDGKYIVVQVFFNQPAWEGVTTGRRSQGYILVNVVWPKNAGTVPAARIAALVEAHFPKNTELHYGGAHVRISAEPWMGTPDHQASEMRTPVTIPWTA